MRTLLMTSVLISVAISHSTMVMSQTIADFENFGLDTDMYLNNSAPEGGFVSGLAMFPNDYSADFDAWQGWAISSMTDNQTPGYLNQYSSIAGSGFDMSTTYATAYAPSIATIHLLGEAAGKTCAGFYLTNAAYAYFSMRDGDAFAKKFGGATGNDPDYFLLTIKGYFGGSASSDSIAVYLADYRFENNQQDYILNEWQWVDLTSLGPVDSLHLQLSSTDIGVFGMNTPAYFCIDHLTTLDGTSSASKPSAMEFQVYPNPTNGPLSVILPPESKVDRLVLTDLTGRELSQFEIRRDFTEINPGNLPKGTYIITAISESGMHSIPLIIR